MAVAMLRAPGESLPQLFTQPCELKAAYRFLDNPHLDPEGLQAGHRQRVREAMQAPGTYLLIEDSSEFSYSGRQPIGGLGFIGDAREGLQGFILHSVLAVRWWGKRDRGRRKRPEVEVLGFARAIPLGSRHKTHAGWAGDKPRIPRASRPAGAWEC